MYHPHVHDNTETDTDSVTMLLCQKQVKKLDISTKVCTKFCCFQSYPCLFSASLLVCFNKLLVRPLERSCCFMQLDINTFLWPPSKQSSAGTTGLLSSTHILARHRAGNITRGVHCKQNGSLCVMLYLSRGDLLSRHAFFVCVCVCLHNWIAANIHTWKQLQTSSSSNISAICVFV